MSYCTGFVLGNVLCGVTYLVLRNKMKEDDDNNEEQPTSTPTQAAQNDVATTNSTISQSTNCNTTDNNDTPEITIRYENILTATANYANLLNNNNNNNELQEESIEYELTDYMLQNDIETIHSMNSLRSKDSTINSLSPSMRQMEDTDNLQLSYSQESVYNNFDDLFEIRDSWMTDNSGSISLETDTIIVGLDGNGGAEARDDYDGEIEESGVVKEGETNVDMGIKDKPNAMPNVEEEGEDGAEILKKLVIKCLVRNNCKGGAAVKGKSSPRSVRSSGGEKEKTFPSLLPKDPSLEENSNMDPSSRQDPPSANETAQQYQQQHQQGSSRVGGGMSVSSINSNRYPPRPDIVRYNNNNMVMMQSTPQPQYKQQPPRPDLIQCNALSAPLNRCHSSYSYSTHAQQVSPRSVVTNPSLPGVVELSPVIEEGGVGSSYVIGQGELRRKRYKELLRQQRQKASPLGSDSTMAPAKAPALV